MQRNLKVTFQVSMVSDLSDGDLKNSVIESVVKTMMSVHKAEPIGLYLITVEPGDDDAFPQLPPSMTDIHVERQREFEKELKEIELWKDR